VKGSFRELNEKAFTARIEGFVSKCIQSVEKDITNNTDQSEKNEYIFSMFTIFDNNIPYRFEFDEWSRE
jgi:hypothetical protein